jgi:hypothetical protein
LKTTTSEKPNKAMHTELAAVPDSFHNVTRANRVIAAVRETKRRCAMSWVKEAVSSLEAGQITKVRPIGGSMRGRIESGQLVTIAPSTAGDVKVDDVVFIRWKGNFILHIVKDIQDGRLLIGNNLGKINGWADSTEVVGIVTSVED